MVARCGRARGTARLEVSSAKQSVGGWVETIAGAGRVRTRAFLNILEAFSV